MSFCYLYVNYVAIDIILYLCFKNPMEIAAIDSNYLLKNRYTLSKTNYNWKAIVDNHHTLQEKNVQAVAKRAEADFIKKLLWKNIIFPLEMNITFS